MSGNIFEDNLKRIDEAFDRGRKMGLMEGATKNKNLAPWNLPATRPKDGEDIFAIVKPFDWKSRRMAKKHGLDYVMLTGFFVDANEIMKDEDPICDEDGNELDFDVVVISKKKCIDWSIVAAWMSVTPPDWIYHKEEDNG